MWHSLHCFIHDYVALDVYLGQRFNEFIETCEKDFEKFFFIRYWLGGPHIRLRFKLRNSAELENIQQRFQNSVDTFLKEYGYRIKLVDKEGYYKPHMLNAENISSTYWCEHGKVIDFTYEPEFYRYGGEKNIYLSEEIFCKSSQMACQLNTLPFPKRVVSAFDLIALTFQEFNIEDEGYKAYLSNWNIFKKNNNNFNIHVFNNVLKSRYKVLLTEKQKFMKVYGSYLSMLKNCFSKMDIEKEKKFPIMASHVHMTNNRIGVTPEYEYELTKLLFEMKADDYSERILKNG